MQELHLGTPGTWYQIALDDRERRALVGDLALRVDASEPCEAEVGFTLAPTEQGRGYATEAPDGLLGYMFETMALHRAFAVTDALNEPAAALLHRIGIRCEAHFVENVFFKGAWGSEFLFAMLDREWTARQAVLDGGAGL